MKPDQMKQKQNKEPADAALLLEKVADMHDAGAARRLAELFSGRMYALAYHILSDRQQAEDTVQDVFVALLTGRAHYRKRGEPASFLFKVTSCIAIDRARKNTRERKKEQKEVLMSHAEEKSIVKQHPVLTTVLRKELKSEVETLVRGLDPKARAALMLRFWEGKKVRDIASILNTTRSSVSRLIKKTLHNLKKPLQEKGFGAAVALSLLRDFLKTMEPPPPSAGFTDHLLSQLKKIPPASGTHLPTLPEPVISTGISLKTAGLAAACTLIISAALVGLFFFNRDPDPQKERSLAGNQAQSGTGKGGEKNTSNQNDTAAAKGADSGTEKTTLAGFVTGLDDKPAAGARVRLLPGEGSLPLDLYYVRMIETPPLEETRTDTRGRFSFHKLSAGTYRICAKAAGTAPGTSGLLRVTDERLLEHIQIRLPEGASVTGTARLENGEPVAGVEVDAILNMSTGAVGQGFWRESMTTNEKGQFQIRGIGKRPAQLFAHSATHAVLMIPKYARQTDKNLEIILSEGSRLSGLVTDSDQKPIEEAEVRIFGPRNPLEGKRQSYEPLYLVRSTQTDANGRFTVTGLASTEHVLTVEKTGFAPPKPHKVQLTPGSVTPDMPHITLSPAEGATISGMFLAGGKPFGPAHGALLPCDFLNPRGVDESRTPLLSMSRFYPNPLEEHLQMNAFKVHADGTFETPPLAGGSYILTAYKNMQQLYSLLSTHAEKKQRDAPATYRPGQKDLQIELPPLPKPFVVSGTVTTQVGKGIANAEVRCSFFTQSDNVDNRSGLTVFTDQNGFFKLIPLLPISGYTSCSFDAQTPNDLRGRLDNLPFSSDEDLEKLQIIINAGDGISGVVLTPSGKPVAGTNVLLTQDGHDPFPRAEERQAKTDADGCFSFGSLQADRNYAVTVQAKGWATATIKGLEADTSNVTFTLGEESVLEGRVVDLDGNPAPISSISLWSHEGNSSSTIGLMRNSTTGEKGVGSFTVFGLPPGTYSLQARGLKQGNRYPVSMQSERIEVGEGETVSGIVLMMTKLVAVTGQVVDAETGDPIAGANVADWDPEDATFPRGRTLVTTDETGSFRLENMQRGSQTLYAASEGYIKLRTSVTITGKEDETIVLKMEPARYFVVAIVNEENKPVAGARVISMLIWPPDHNLKTDENGLAMVPVPGSGIEEAIKKGRNQISISSGGYAEKQVTITQDIIEAGNITVTLQASARIFGTVTDHEGNPVENIWVVARHKNRGIANTTKRNGAYSIGSLQAADYTVVFSSRKYPLPSWSKEVTLGKGESVKLDFTIPPPESFSLYPVRIVTQFEDGTPAADVELHLHEAWRGSGRDRTSIELLPYYRNQMSLKTDENGVLEILFEEDTVERVSFSGNFYRNGNHYRLFDGEGKVVNGEIKAVYRRVPMGTVVLRVLDDAGDPVPAYRYMCRTKGKGGSGGSAHQLNETSRETVAPGEVTVSVEAKGYEKAEKTITLSDREEKEVEIRLVKQSGL